MAISIQPSASVAAALSQLGRYPALMQQAIHKAIGRTVKSGRANLVRELSAQMAVRWKTIIKRRAKYKFFGPTSGEVRLTDEPMSATSFKGKFSNRGYTMQVMKDGYTVVIPSAFKGKGLDGKFSLFSRDENAASRRQMAGHYKKNIGKMRKPTHKVVPITMSQIVARKPEIVAKETAFLQAIFERQITKGVARALGVK